MPIYDNNGNIVGYDENTMMLGQGDQAVWDKYGGGPQSSSQPINYLPYILGAVALFLILKK